MKWNLDCFFSGKNFSHQKEELSKAIEALQVPKVPNEISVLLQALQSIDEELAEWDALISCLQAQNIADAQANQWRAEFASLEAKYQTFNNAFDAWLIQLSPAAFVTLCQEPACAEVQFVLQERKKRAAQKLSLPFEDLITDLSIDGYHGWGELYPSLVAEVRIPFQGQQLSFGQAENKLSDSQKSVRQEVFHALEGEWKKKETLFAQVLNHIAGFRLKIYEKRGWDDVLHEPLFENRMSNKTLQAMWHAVEQHKKPLVAFLQAKAEQLNVSKLAWYDVDAPLANNTLTSFPYKEGAALIVEKFAAFHPRMGEFARQAFAEQWIEAEDRPGKRPGGFCVPFPKSRQSRIFMTYSGTIGNLSTLAHELGHAYHNAMVEELPRFSQQYRMNVAETASTFAEQIISDALLQQCKTNEEKCAILSDRLENAVAYLMNIHARFLFETQFYEQRKKGFIPADELCQLMQTAQEKAYGGALGQWHPYFWAAKMHFYFTGVPFYNFPYTFGYLFSLGLYALAKKHGPEFAQKYDVLLKETGMMSVEDLVRKHLQIDLTQPDFWNMAAALAVSDVDQYLSLTKVST